MHQLYPFPTCETSPLPLQGYQYSWCVDPLDGTKEFLKRNGQFTVNIALLRVRHAAQARGRCACSVQSVQTCAVALKRAAGNELICFLIILWTRRVCCHQMQPTTPSAALALVLCLQGSQPVLGVVAVPVDVSCCCAAALLLLV